MTLRYVHLAVARIKTTVGRIGEAIAVPMANEVNAGKDRALMRPTGRPWQVAEERGEPGFLWPLLGMADWRGSICSQ